ncbi:MAG: hypothetical protein HY709_07565, partial [Candidatus Latescibacteria bacterium]|nr:hypothetical protein [Candidatus Latescibacterota bacterium]
LNTLLIVYDQAAQSVLDVAQSEGYFDGWDPTQIAWPPSLTESGPIGVSGLQQRIRLITTIYDGVPRLRDSRLADACEQFVQATPAYREANRTYSQIKKQFLDQDAGTAQDLTRLYHTVYLEALKTEPLFTPDPGEAALERARISRVPLSHAQPVAEKLTTPISSDDPLWSTRYHYTIDGKTTRAPLRDLLPEIARRTLDYIATGELLSVRFNTYSNFAWFGSSVWKVISDAELLLTVLRQPAAHHRAIRRQLDALESQIRLGQSMMIEFFQAHRENPSHMKPIGYWYGYQYSYLTRDMIDLTRQIIDRSNHLIRRMKGSEWQEFTIPPLLAGRARGRFLEYPHVGKTAQLSNRQRSLRFGRWIIASWWLTQRKKALSRSALGETRRLELAWQNNLQWADATLRMFGIRVKILIDPEFSPIAEELDLAGGGKSILFLPTHQSLLDHPVMYHALQSPELMAALGWQHLVPCVILARAGLAESVMLKIGPWSITLFGISSRAFDRLLEEVDGYAILPRSGDTGNATQRFADTLKQRPGVIYAAGTTAAFDIQSLPLQHALFNKLPQDVIIIPLAFRGIHALWPKSPKRNLYINPGLVEVMVAPPMLGETTLLPKRRSLRPQLEPAALFQAVQIINLLNPHPVE